MVKVVCVSFMVEVRYTDGIGIGDDSIKLAADTAARRNSAESENMHARTLWTERRILGKPLESGRPVPLGELVAGAGAHNSLRSHNAGIERPMKPQKEV